MIAYHIYDLRGAVFQLGRLKHRDYKVCYCDGMCGEGYYLTCKSHRFVTMYLGDNLEDATKQVLALLKEYKCSLHATRKDHLGENVANSQQL